MINLRRLGRQLGALAVGALISAVATQPLQAAEICFLNVNVGNTACVAAPADTTLFGHDTRVIDTGQHHKTGTYLDVEEVKRTKKKWPLGKPSLQNCRFCLEPNRQNAQRLNSLP